VLSEAARPRLARTIRLLDRSYYEFSVGGRIALAWRVSGDD